MCTGSASDRMRTWTGCFRKRGPSALCSASSVKSLDDKAALGVAGVKQTATIDAFKPPIGFQALGGRVAVLADNTWAAMQGRKKLKIEWEKSPHSVLELGRVQERVAGDSAETGKVVRENGTWTRSSRRVESSSRRNTTRQCWRMLRWSRRRRWPCTAMEKWKRGRPRRIPKARGCDCAGLGLKKERCDGQRDAVGGAFGRKSFPDFAVEAAVLSKKTGKPVR